MAKCNSEKPGKSATKCLSSAKENPGQSKIKAGILWKLDSDRGFAGATV